MSRDRPLSESGPGSTASKKQFVSVKDYGTLNPLPCLATIFRKSGSKSRSGGGKMDPDCADVLLHSVMTITSAVAEEVRFTAQGKRVVVGQLKFLIPSEYSGWFEVLSQDGRATRPIEAVRELSGLTTPSFVVRQPVSAYRQQAGDRSWATEVVREGALLRSQELVESLPQKTQSDSSGDVDVVKGPFLRCLDANGGVVYLSLEVRGLFSPVACRSSIVGAHDIRSLLAKFRLPVLVRLIHHGEDRGSESETESGVRNQQQRQFPGAGCRTQRIFRLVGKYSEDIAFALLLNNSKTSGGGKDDDDDDGNMLPLPANDKYLISKTETRYSNRQSVITQAPTDDDEIKSLRKQCDTLISNFRNSIRPSVTHRRHWLMSDRVFDLELIERNQLNSASDSNAPTKPLSFEEQQLFREIEELYADVRNPRHLLSPPKLRLARQRHRRDPAETTTKFPKSFKMASFSNGALVGNTFLFSRNPVFQGNPEKSNRKHASKDDLDQLVPPAIASARHGRKDGNDDGQAGVVKHQAPVGVRSAATSRENLYEEVVAIKPINTAGHREQQWPWARGRLQKPKLEMTDAPRNAEAEQQNKNTKIQRTSSHHNGPGDKHTKGQRNTGNRITTAKDNGNQNEQPAHPVDRIEATDPVARDSGLLDLHRESNDRSSHRLIDQTGAAKPALLRPKSYAGTPHADPQRMTSYHPSVTTIPGLPSSPPKRVKSFAEVNVLSELPNGTELTVSPSFNQRQDRRLLSKSTTALNSSSSPLPPPQTFNSNFTTNRRSNTHAVNEENRPVPSKYASPELKSSKDNHLSAGLLKPERRLRIRSANDDTFPSYV